MKVILTGYTNQHLLLAYNSFYMQILAFEIMAQGREMHLSTQIQTLLIDENMDCIKSEYLSRPDCTTEDINQLEKFIEEQVEKYQSLSPEEAQTFMDQMNENIIAEVNQIQKK